MSSRNRLWIGMAFVVVLVLVPGSMAGGSEQTARIFRDVESTQPVTLGLNAASTEYGLSVMTSETQSAPEALAAQVDDCDDPDHGKKIKCKSQKLMAEVCNTAALAAQDDTGIFADSTTEEFTNLCNYGTAVIEATDEAEFKGVGMRRQAGGGAGAVMEYVGEDSSEHQNDGDDDGICQPKGKKDVAEATSDEGGAGGRKPSNLYKEWCAEVIGDGIGDDDGWCEYQDKGQNRYLEPCLQVVGVDAIDGQEENFDEDKLLAIEDALDAHTGALRQSNAAFVKGMEELRTQQAIAQDLLTGDALAACANLKTTEYGSRPTHLSMKILLGLAVGMEGAYDACDSAANQDAAGFNGSAACVPLAIGEAVENGLYQSEELRDDMITGARLDNAVQCLEHLGQQLNDIKQGVDEANFKLDVVVEHRQVHLQVVELKEKREFLISVTEAVGQSHLSHPIFESYAVRASVKQPLSFVDVTNSTTWTDQGNGLYLVTVDLPQSLKNADIFVFEVWHTHESGIHSGFTLFDRSAQNNVGVGQ